MLFLCQQDSKYNSWEDQIEVVRYALLNCWTQIKPELRILKLGILYWHGNNTHSLVGINDFKTLNLVAFIVFRVFKFIIQIDRILF